jgi:hypothetical protein
MMDLNTLKLSDVARVDPAMIVDLKLTIQHRMIRHEFKLAAARPAMAAAQLSHGDAHQ